ncbi:MAG: tol-pal system-associated acyl-CoA thioesterase [Geminicoccaceae bacterium]
MPKTGSKTVLSRTHDMTIRVYYEDTDAAGIVYYANYLKFAERARTEMLRDFGADHRALGEELGVTFVVRRCLIDYHRPAKLDDLLEIRTHVANIGGARLDLLQQVRCGGDLLVSLSVRLALLNDVLKPVRLPSVLIAALGSQYEVGN